jgi:hypothetical protein
MRQNFFDDAASSKQWPFREGMAISFENIALQMVTTINLRSHAFWETRRRRIKCRIKYIFVSEANVPRLGCWRY